MNKPNRFKFRAWDKKINKMIVAPIIPKTQWILYLNDIFREDLQPYLIFMESTGLIDSKGKEIFEGDIVKVHKFTQELGENMGVSEGEKEFIAKINFSVYGGIFLSAKNNDSCPLWEYEDGFHEESLEIIGNIHENPELLSNN